MSRRAGLKSAGSVRSHPSALPKVAWGAPADSNPKNTALITMDELIRIKQDLAGKNDTKANYYEENLKERQDLQ